MSKKSAAEQSQTDLKIVENQVPVPERRESKRIPFYRGEFPEAKILHGGKSYPAEVFDLSTKGIGVVPKCEVPGLDTVSQVVMVQVGDSAPREAVLKNISHIKFAGSLRLKLGMLTKEWKDSQASEEPLFSCSESMPLAYCEDPIAFNRTLLFNVSHFSKNGLVVKTKFVEGAFFSGLTMDLRLMMPARGEFSAAAEIVEMHRSEDRVELFCRWRNAPQKLLNSVSEFLLMTVPDLTIKGLRENGFLVADLEKAFLFRYAQTAEEMEQILKLRLVAAKGEGRWLDTEDHTVMRDQWDAFARQIYCEVNGKVVAASRIVFNNGLRERSEHVNYKVNIPEWMWEAGFVEGSRVCTDPAFRGTDVFSRMVQQMSHIVSQSGHRYLLMNCVDNLVPVYRKIVGVITLGEKFHTPFMQKDALNLLYVDVRTLQIGTNVKYQSWAVNAPIGDHAIERGHFKLKWWERPLRLFFKPIHLLIYAVARRKKFAKAAQSLNKR